MDSDLILEELKSSNVMDTRYGLPLVGIHRNPHLYFAVVFKILIHNDVIIAFNEFYISYMEFLKDCEVKPGLITTYPGSEAASHDDIMGVIESMRPAGVCSRVLNYLKSNYGNYNYNGSRRANFFRFFYFYPYLKASIGKGFPLVLQILYSIHVLFHLYFTKKGEFSGHNKLWVTFKVMKRYRLTRAVIKFWSKTQEARGITPKYMYQNHYLKECPWFGKWAPESWL
jgi:hypothetical protein